MKSLQFLVLFLFLSVEAKAETTEQYVAEAGATIGKAYILRAGEKIPLTRGLKLLGTDQVLTSKNAAVEIIFADGSNILAREDSSIKIEEYKTVMKGSRLTIESSINQVRGKVRYFFKPRAGGTNATVKTRNSVMGIRGTILYVDNGEENKETHVTVARGRIEVANALNPSEKVEVKENETIRVSENKKPDAPKLLPPQEMQKIVEDDKKVLAEKKNDGFIPETLELPAPVIIADAQTLKSNMNDPKPGDGENKLYCGLLPCTPKLTTQQIPICNRDSINYFIQKAQRFEPEATLWAQTLLQCPGVEDVVLFWLNFFYRGQGQMSRAAEVGQLLPPESGESPSTERARIVRKAIGGQSKDLHDAVEAKTKGFDDYEALLVLARSLVRENNYGEARKYYERALSLKTISQNRNSVNIEIAYSYLLEGNFEEAKNTFENVLLLDISEEEKKSALRGFEIADNNKFEIDKIETLNVQGNMTEFSGEQGIKKLSELFSYDGKYALIQGTMYQLKRNNGGDAKNYQGNEIRVRSSKQVLNGLKIEGMLGYLSFNKTIVPFELTARLDYNSGFFASLGGEQTPLFWTDYIDEVSLLYTKQNFNLGIGFQKYIKVTGQIFSIEGNNSGSAFNAQSKFELISLPPDQHLLFVLGASQTQFVSSNAHYFSPKSWTTVDAGISSLTKISQNFALAVDLSFASFQQTLHADTAIYNNTYFEKLSKAESGTILKTGGGIYYSPAFRWKVFVTGNSVTMKNTSQENLSSETNLTVGINSKL